MTAPRTVSVLSALFADPTRLRMAFGFRGHGTRVLEGPPELVLVHGINPQLPGG